MVFGGQAMTLIVINLVFTFAFGNISVGGHLGGLAAGASACSRSPGSGGEQASPSPAWSESACSASDRVLESPRLRLNTERMRGLAFVVLPLATAAPAAAAPPLLGGKGDAAAVREPDRQQSAVQHAILGWGQGDSWGSSFAALLPTLGPTPMIGLGTGRNGREAITPQQIAQGRATAT